MDAVGPYLTAILPTILVSVLFYFLIKSMIEGDRRERLAQRRFEAEQDARRAASVSGEDPVDTSDTASADDPPVDGGNSSKDS